MLPTDPSSDRPAPAHAPSSPCAPDSPTPAPAAASPAAARAGEALVRAAELLSRRQWHDAAELLAPIAHANPSLRLQFNLARNMGGLQRRRPDVYQRLLQAQPASQCRVVEAPRNQHSILSRRPGDANWTCLTAGNDPAATLAQYQGKITPFVARGAPIALCGLGDGFVAAWIAQAGAKPANLFGLLGALYLLESDPQVILHLFMLHDLSGPDGPIAQERCLWFVGHTCLDDYRGVLLDQPYLPLPDLVIWQGLTGDALRAGAEQLHHSLREQDNLAARRIEAHYASLDPRATAALWGDAPPRSPRVLVATSRFSRVLQHSARDARDAFERLGCQTRLVIEPADHGQVTTRAIRQALESFRPDLVLLIDHLRAESGAIFPGNLPMLCWIQDDFPHLTSSAAAASIGLRDFVLTADIPTYTRAFGYPERQCIFLEKLTRVPQRPAAWTSDGADLAYVSNASREPRAAIADFLQRYDSRPHLRLAIEGAAQDMLSLYDAGGSLHHFQQVRELIAQHLPERGNDAPASAELAALSLDLFNLVNNLLYRQQALAWIAQAAKDLGLSLALYGHGWESHPRFAPYAKGPIAYGPDLEALARSTRINLQIVPYSCLHQRLLDGLVAGGFFLVRDFPLDAVNRRIERFVERHLGPDVASLRQARDVLTEPLFAQLQALIAEHAHCLGQALPDLLAAKHHTRQAGLDFLDRGLPRLEEVGFTDAASARRLIERFIGDERLRHDVARAQEAFVLQHLTYEQGLRRVTRAMAGLLDAEPAITRPSQGDAA